MKSAFQKYAQAGWMGLCMPEQWGGQNQSSRLGSFVGELLTSANHAFSMTEAHCGSDLGLIRTSATANPDSSYQLKGSKIFISAGSHDASDNIIHLVLVRLKDSENSKEGIKGLSLFLVPEKVKAFDGAWTKDNNVHCIGIEEKMGVHGNPTCSINFGNAQGYLIGEENKGINAMFAMMNEMRSLSGVKNPELEADPLIVHPDVRRMLLTQKFFAEGGRALAQFCSQLMDESIENDHQERSQLLDMLTPSPKASIT